MLRAQTTSSKMKQRIWKMKLLLAKMILSQERSVAKDIYQEQIKCDWPWLAAEIKDICENVGVSNLNEDEVSKEELEDGIYYHHYKEMKLEGCGYKKLEAVKKDDFTKLPEYMNEKSVDRARLAFRIKSEMVNTI